MAEEQQQEEGGFFSNPLVMIGGLLMGALMFFPNLISGLFGAIGSLFSGLMSGSNQQSGSQSASNPLSGLLSMFGLGGTEPAKETAPVVTPPTTPTAPAVTPPATNTAQGQSQSNGLTEMFASVMKMFSDGMTSLMGGTANAAQAPKTPTTPAVQPTPQNQPTVQQKPAAQGNGFMDMLSGMWKQVTGAFSSVTNKVSSVINGGSGITTSNVVATVHDVSAVDAKLSHDKSRACSAAVDQHGNLIKGNNALVVGDLMSTTKMVTCGYAVKCLEAEGKLPKGFLEKMNKQYTWETKGGKKPLVDAIAQYSDNDAANKLLELTAKQMGLSKDQTIDTINGIFAKQGFKELRIANFSGLTASDGGYFRSGGDSKGNAYELAVAMQRFTQFPDAANIFNVEKNRTGIADRSELANAGYGKTGTGLGTHDRESGANKSLVLSERHGKGSVAVLEAVADAKSKKNWISEASTMLASLNSGGFPVENSTSIASQSGGGKTKSAHQAIT